MTTQVERLPVAGLCALAVAGFVTILTEALPAGLLPQIGGALDVSDAMAGQWISIYALGSLLAAIPLTAATRSWRRRPLLLSAIIGFAIANLFTALTASFIVAMAARFVGGVSAGLLWALLAGYAVRMAPPCLAGRAMAIAMAGTPLALSIGIPAGTFIGNLAGWRLTFGLLSVIALLLVGWIIAKVPDFPGEPETQRPSLTQVFVVPGVRPVLAVTLCFVLAHNFLYTYIAPLLASHRMTGQIDSVLLVFGGSALVSIGLTGVLIDKWLRPLTFTGIGLFLVAVLILAVTTGASSAIYGAAIIWGLAFGGSATVFQTASARAAGPAADVAQAMIVTAWNIAIFGGAVMGGVVLQTAGAGGLPWAGIALLLGAAGSALCVKR
ncbi:MFS transporter [Rhizobium sp. NFR03]|uniref:MFS transporter n=1 Tax=Rhizobium sp. NFR03 TaxID=1566263 RepID=UPI0008B6A5F0|nr:MFS transporter [Rhizobium sp. NFR03]SES40548.1 Predicted arabinose efflux permease, MFS family [Rhizobium sp. NFR03]